MKKINQKSKKAWEKWHQRAGWDYSSAVILLKNQGVPAIVCFHCHQVVEKLLKGFLAYHRVDYPKSLFKIFIILLQTSNSGCKLLKARQCSLGYTFLTFRNFRTKL
jgi:hypothetical protein